MHACAVRVAEDVALAHLVFEQPGVSLRRGRGRDETVDGVLLARETVAKQAIHGSLTILAEVTGCRGADSVSAERCDDLGRSVWSSPASAGLLAGPRRDTRSLLIRAAAPRHDEQHERKQSVPLIASPRPVRPRIVEARMGWASVRECPPERLATVREGGDAVLRSPWRGARDHVPARVEPCDPTGKTRVTFSGVM